MDPNGGTNPSAPRLDTAQPASPQQPVDIYSQPQSFDPAADAGGASIPSEMPAAGPVMQDLPPTTDFTQQPVPDLSGGFPAPQAPQFQDASPSYQPPMDPDPMLGQPMMEASGQPKAPGGGRKIIMMVGGLVIGILALGGAAFAGYTMGKTAGRQQAAAEFQTQQAAAQETETTTTQQDVALDLSKTVQTKDVKDEELTGKVGEQVNASDGFAVQVTNIERNFAPDDAEYKLDEGKELVKVNFVMGNFAEDKAKNIKSADLYLEEGDGTKVTPESRLTKYDGYFDTTTIQPGEQAVGSIVYAVTKDVTPLVFVREQIYEISNQNKRITTKISINLTD